MRAPGQPLTLLRWLGPLVWIGFGVLVLLTLNGAVNTVTITGWLALLIGIVLLVVAFLRFRAGRRHPRARCCAPCRAVAAAASTPPVATAPVTPSGTAATAMPPPAAVPNAPPPVQPEVPGQGE